MAKLPVHLTLIFALILSPSPMTAQELGATVQSVALDQGRNWTDTRRAEFYTGDQGSRIMPLAWFKSLRRHDGTAFLPEGLVRYGYIANPASAEGLPVGFSVDSAGPGRAIGMTCAACHTREIEVAGTRYRADGGPATVDFQAFLTDLDFAVGHILSDNATFAAFARDVGAIAGQRTDAAQLRVAVELWYTRYHTLIVRALPQGGWGLGRLDAVSMILNRLTGLDLGPPPTFLIPDNIAVADAPVRYPFIWNASKQDHIQWPGFAQNGDELFGLARNLGEVYGVFGIFTPHKSSRFLLGYDYVTGNSANFDGLRRLEYLVSLMDAPRWPWLLNAPLVTQGKRVFERPTAEGGCQECHGVRRGAVRLVPPSLTWKTPILDVGTDSREYQVLSRVAATGAIEGAITPSLGRLGPRVRSFDILATSVIGSILQHDLAVVKGTPATADGSVAMLLKRPVKSELAKAFELPAGDPKVGHYKYEARVLSGVWAVAPYLHNGAVPTLAELLKPPAQRAKSFLVGSNYDRDTVGLAQLQPGLSGRRTVTGCDLRDSGDSNCGHDFGTWLSAGDKAALLEYLKTL